jgi:hypothetical protein
MYNRIQRYGRFVDTTNSWTYATATYRAWNNSTANRVEFVVGVAEDCVSMDFLGYQTVAGAVIGTIGIGLDSVTVDSSILKTASAGTPPFTTNARYVGVPTVGYHYLSGLEYAGGATVTFYGDNGTTTLQSGATAQFRG